MPRKTLNRSDFYPYHVTARSNNREPFPLDISQIWQIICNEAFAIHIKFEVEIHAFVLMPNHFHLLLTVPTMDLGQVMNVFMRNITKDIHLESGNTGRVFGGPYHWSLINSSQYYYHALKYVYRNPVRAGLCEKVEDYSYSTFSGAIGNNILHFPLVFTRASMESRFPGSEPSSWVEWLNRPFLSESEKWIRMGLKRAVFLPPLNHGTRKPQQILD